ncbi:MAG: pyrroloquinoline quinone biosynthesis protein PqqB [Geminicoccaceae bacterium]
MRLIVLGAAAGGGFPQWNSACPVGRRAWAGDPAAGWRTQCAVAISADGERWTLLNASPDLRQQILATPALQPKRGPRHSPIGAVVLTSGDVDHVAGLLTLRESQPFALYATAAILEVLESNPIFNVLDPAFVRRRRLRLEQPVALDGGPTVVPFAVPGKVALYLEDDALEIGALSEDVIGLELQDAAGARAFFVPGCARLTPELAERLRGAALVLFDGTLWTDDEMIQSGTGVKTGARMGHMSVVGPAGTMAAFARLGVRRRILIHINNTNPMLLEDSAERAAALAAGWEVAHDGMEITL